MFSGKSVHYPQLRNASEKTYRYMINSKANEAEYK